MKNTAFPCEDMEVQESNTSCTPIIRGILAKYPVLTHEKMLHLFAQRVPGFDKNNKPTQVLTTEAFDELYFSNMRLAIAHATKQRNRGVDVEDLIEVGGLGL